MPTPEVQTRSGGRSGLGGLLSGLAMLAGLLLVRKMLRWATSGRLLRQPRQPRVDQGAVQVGHETRDAPVLPVVIGVVAVAVAIGLAVLVASWVQTSQTGRSASLSQPPGFATPVPPPPPPEPRLEEEPGAQLQELRAAEDQILNGTAWVDRQAGIARIPIDRAIDLLAANPPPARSAEEASQYGDESGVLPSDASSGRAPAGEAP
jgi:hypothetical protein